MIFLHPAVSLILWSFSGLVSRRKNVALVLRYSLHAHSALLADELAAVVGVELLIQRRRAQWLLWFVFDAPPLSLGRMISLPV